MKGILIIILLLLLNCCKSPDNSIVEFDPRILDENKITLSEIADDITYIPLDNSLQLDQIHPNFRFTKNSIWLCVTFTGILEFNRDGKFVRKIGNIGRGPGEYVYYSEFKVDDNKEIIYVKSESGRRDQIKAYSRTGDFLKSITPPVDCDMLQNFEISNSNFLGFNYQNMGYAKYNWVVFDTLGNILTKKPRTLPLFQNGLSAGYGTYKCGNIIYYWDSYNDTVYSILPDFKYKPSFIVSPGEHRIPRAPMPFPPQLIKYLRIFQIFETSHFIVIQYAYKKSTLVLIDKENREAFVLFLGSEQLKYGTQSTGGIENDLDGGSMFLPQNYYEENGREYMVGLINPFQLLIHTKSDEFKNSIPKYPEKKKELEKLVDNLKETDNPVLMMVRLKK